MIIASYKKKTPQYDAIFVKKKKKKIIYINTYTPMGNIPNVNRSYLSECSNYGCCIHFFYCKMYFLTFLQWVGITSIIGKKQNYFKVWGSIL